MYEDVIRNLKKYEGFKSKIYLDSRGFETIGYGFLMKDFDLKENEAEIILRRKVLEFIEKIDKAFVWFLSMPLPIQKVIIEMCYQIGIEGFAEFKNTIEAMKRHDFKMAADHMLDSDWADQTPARAEELAERVRLLS